METNNISIIGVDFSNGEDNSAITIRCGNYGEILYMTTTPDNNIINCNIYKKCPKYEIEFKKYIVIHC